MARARHKPRKKTRSARGAGSYAMGRNCIREMLEHCPARIEMLYVADADIEQRKRLAQLVQMASEAGIPCTSVEARELTELVDSDSHQSVVAKLHRRELLSLAELIDTASADEKSLILAFDAIQDPHNIGALLRSAECFGISGAVWCPNRCAPLTAVVAKSSVGALELQRIAEVSNLSQALDELRKRDYWIIAADAGPGAESLMDFEFPQRSVLVLGSEGEGLSRLVLEKSDYRVRIPQRGLIDSLNVAQAASVITYEWSRQLG